MTYELQGYEVFLVVEDYYLKNGRNSNLAFNQCAADVNAAEAAFREEMKERKLHIDSISLIEFVEFDSPNVGHANAYFDVRYFGDPVPEES